MNTWTKRWDDRYKSQEFAYGTAPNNYLKEQIEKLKPGNILFPAEGEGRNAIKQYLSTNLIIESINQKKISKMEDIKARHKF